MAFAVKDRVKETSNTTGTGSLTLTGAVTGYQSFNAALSNGDTTYYVIENPNTSEWETGVGTFTSPSTLARTTVLSSSTGSAVSFTAGAKNVFISLPATQFPAANTTIVGTDATQTLTNKSISGASNTVTNVSLTTGVTGTLPVANGGTGVTSSTGTGSVVLSASPTLTGTLSGAAASFTGNMGSQTLTVNHGATNSTSTVALVNTGASGINIAMTGNGATTPNKYLRVFNGSFDIVNNAYSAAIWSLTDAGNMGVGGTSTLSGATTMGNALTYGGVTLANSVTGTGSMVLSASPTLTGTMVVPSVNLSTSGTAPGTLGMWNASGTYLAFRGGSTGYIFNDAANSTTYAVIEAAKFDIRPPILYGGVTLANSVTGTGSMVLSANPQFTATAGLPVQIYGALGNPFTTGTTPTGSLRFINPTDSGQAQMGIRAGGAGFWIQSGDITQSTFYPLLLNPSGGGVTIGGALTYGGVTLSNSVTGTGSMVLSASPTLTGTLTAATANFSGQVAFNYSGDTQTLYKNGGGTTVAYVGTTGAFGGITTDALRFRSDVGEMAWGFSGFVYMKLTTSLLTLTSALNYGGVTLSNSVTGTGSMVLSASPTFTGTLSAAAITATGAVSAGSGTSSGAPTGNFFQTITGGQTGAYVFIGSAGSSYNSMAMGFNYTSSGSSNNFGSIGIYGISSNINIYGDRTVFTNATTLGAALTYGGVTLSNSVTGTGSMVLSASPTLTGTVTAATANFSGQVGFTYNGDTQTLYKNGGGTTVAYVGTVGAFGGITTDALRFRSDVGEMAWGFTGAVYMKLTTSLLTLSSALNYGGVTLANSVTGTGSMVLSTSISNYLSGLTLSTAGSSATFSVAAGTAMDATNASAMVLTSALSKTTSAWAVGNANGALDTGAIANSTWYSVWEIMRTDTGVVDVLISTSATAPTMPASYDRKRRIGWIKTNGSAQWFSFLQIGDDFFYAQTTEASYGATQGATLTTLSMVPPSVVPYMSGYASSVNNTGTSITIAPASNSALSVVIAYSANGAGTGIYEQFGVSLVAQTNSSRQIYVAVPAMSNGGAIYSSGWNDSRGKDG